MTDFAALLQSGAGSARTIEIVATQDFDTWRGALGERARAAIAAARFKAKAGEIVVLPGDAPGDWSVAGGVGAEG